MSKIRVGDIPRLKLDGGEVGGGFGVEVGGQEGGGRCVWEGVGGGS